MKLKRLPSNLIHLTMLSLVILIGLITLTSCQLPRVGIQCIQRRAALDIGSGSTKVLAVKMNTCERKILETEQSLSIPLKFKESINLNNGRLSEDNLKEAIEKISPILKSLRHKNFEIRAVATEAFRQANNGVVFITRLSSKIGIDIELIDQQREAELGFWGAVGSLNKDPRSLVVWDIGGGSMQMSSIRLRKLFYYLGKTASVSFKDEVLKLKGKKRGSPNPLGPHTALAAVDLARDIAKAEVDIEIKEESQEKEVIGIGGVHFFSVRKGLGLPAGVPYSQYQLQLALNQKSSWDDFKLGGNYSETDVTNLALILGFMRELKINSVMPAQVNLATGLLFTESFW